MGLAPIRSPPPTRMVLGLALRASLTSAAMASMPPALILAPSAVVKLVGVRFPWKSFRPRMVTLVGSGVRVPVVQAVRPRATVSSRTGMVFI